MKATWSSLISRHSVTMVCLLLFCYFASYSYLHAKTTESPGVSIVNAKTGEEIDDIEFAVYNLAELPNELTIVDFYTGFLDPDDVESVKFILNGKFIRTENFVPYALAGDNNGQYHPFNFTPGEYELETVYYSGNRATGTKLGSTIVYFTIIDVPPIVFEATKVNATVAAGNQTTAHFNIIVENVDFDYSLNLDERYIPSWLSFPNPMKVGRNKVKIIADNLAPGIYTPNNPILVTLEATSIPFSQAAEIDVEIEVSDSDNLLVFGFTIVDAETDRDVYSYTGDGASQNYFSMPSMFNIRADVNPEVVGSVKFEYAYQCTTCDPKPLKYFRTENVIPYALFGDRKGNYYSEPLAGGWYHVQATPYSDRNAKGTKGKSKEFELYIYNAPSNERTIATTGSKLNIYPNPFNNETTIAYQPAEDAWVVVEIYDLQGTLVQRLHNNHLSSREHISLPFRPGSSAQIYLCKVTSGNKVETKRLYLNR